MMNESESKLQTWAANLGCKLGLQVERHGLQDVFLEFQNPLILVKCWDELL